jgi:hypothetical protein
MSRILFFSFVAAVVLVLLYLASGLILRTARRVVGAYREYRGKRLVVCPETRQHVAVEVDAAHAAATAAAGDPELRLRSCTRWPERAGCDQDCVHQIERAPHDCAVRTLLAEFYEGKSCALCGKAFGQITWADHKPAFLRTEDRRTFEWRDLAPETLPAVFETHLPVCWNCHVAESFRFEHPELVTDRDSRRAAQV